MLKDFRPIDEQLAILKSRDLAIEDEVFAKEFLLKNNYYRVSGYSLTLRNHDLFYPTATFQNIVDIYDFDRELRNLLLSAIEIIEVNFKSIFTYLFSQRYGGLGYLDSVHFSSKEKYDSVMKKTEDQKVKRLSHEAFLKHFVNELNEPIPFWAYIDLLTIADVSILYSLSESSLKDAVARQYRLTHKTASGVMEKYMHGITIVRNLCAHGSRLFNRLFITKPTLNQKELQLLNKTSTGVPDNGRLFGYVLNMRRLLSLTEFTAFKAQLTFLCAKYPFVDMRYYGFCPNWEEIL